MSNTQHTEEAFTKGEWRKSITQRNSLGKPQSFVFREISNITKSSIANVFGNTIEEAEANANLIASCKDIYYALKELYECDYTSGTHLHSAQLKAFSALTKANPNYKPKP